MRPKNIYLCCQKEKAEQYRKKAAQTYLDNAVVLKKLSREVDLVIAIGPANGDMQKELERIRLMGLPVVSVNQALVPMDIYNGLLGV